MRGCLSEKEASLLRESDLNRGEEEMFPGDSTAAITSRHPGGQPSLWIFQLVRAFIFLFVNTSLV